MAISAPQQQMGLEKPSRESLSTCNSDPQRGFWQRKTWPFRIIIGRVRWPPGRGYKQGTRGREGDIGLLGLRSKRLGTAGGGHRLAVFLLTKKAYFPEHCNRRTRRSVNKARGDSQMGAYFPSSHVTPYGPPSRLLAERAAWRTLGGMNVSAWGAGTLPRSG